jgi:hypothetical protein
MKGNRSVLKKIKAERGPEAASCQVVTHKWKKNDHSSIHNKGKIRMSLIFYHTIKMNIYISLLRSALSFGLPSNPS